MFDNALWIHPKCQQLSAKRTMRHCAKLDDDTLLVVDGNATYITRDDGQTWSDPRPIYDGPGPGVPTTALHNGAAIRTRQGTLILVYVDDASLVWEWDEATRRFSDNSQRDLWAIRSHDQGRTWINRQRIPPEWYGRFSGCVMDGIQTGSGRVVIPTQVLFRDPARWGTSAIYSDDEGETWRPSNFIDIGGNGNHDGGFEATLAELSDGRLLMLMRTNLDCFWEAYSTDQGRYWREIRPSRIDASSAPGILKRLASGRLVLAWNRLYPEGDTSYYRYAGQGAEVERSQHRRELSIAFSGDDAKTWSKPAVIAKAEDTAQGRAQVSYPMIFERRPGELWISTDRNMRAALNKSAETEKYDIIHLPPLHVKLREADFVG